ncbi:hypothetical protein Hanom_Chr02g00102561 [Helianthus anomalus]
MDLKPIDLLWCGWFGRSYLLQLLVFCKLQNVNLLMVGAYTELLVLNYYIYKFCMILKLPISHTITYISNISP